MTDSAHRPSPRAMLSATLGFLLRPFTRALPLLAALICLDAVVNCIHWCRMGYASYAVYATAQGVVTSYLLVLAICSLKGMWRKAATWIVVTWEVLWCVVDTFCFTELLAPFSPDFAAAMRATNLSETGEFLETFFTAATIAYLAAALTLAFGLWYLLRRMDKTPGHRWSIAMLCTILLLTALTLRNPSCLEENRLRKTAVMFRPFPTIDASAIDRHPAVNVEHPDSLAAKVVLIVGESYSRDHCGLYGYDKNTTPRLQALSDSGRLVVYADPWSMRTSTVAAFKSLMGAGSDAGDDWYRHPQIPCVFSEAGYRTHWISNQSRRGMIDNQVTVFAELCDTAVFIGNTFSGTDRNTYDGELLPHIRSMARGDGPDFYVVHLIGSHNTFSKRYPPERGAFTISDYADRPANQRERLMHYDNSVAYNDYVVDAIMQEFAGQEAVVIYFPDHGYDIFDTDPDYVGQGRGNNTDSWRAGRRIPLVVYISESYERRFPARAEAIRRAAAMPVNTDTIIRPLTRMAGISLP